ncbi:phosphocholine cytidylyltransferase family protein [Shewanella maritima]|uniref:phosphocholine cytidylyltransferase family protein n=1 Tax=Shewanella maritima TaxID=2520507 RepID=UPI003735D09F
MKAIILAAGRGSRLGNLTDNAPKPLTKLLGKPLIEWQIDALQQAGINSISVINGYNGRLLEKYGDSPIHNPNWDKGNMVRTLLCADTLLQQQTVIVSYGDIVYRNDIVKQLLKNNSPIATTYDTQWNQLWSERFDDPLSDAETFQHNNGLLTNIGDKATSIKQINGQYMGLIKFSPSGWQQVKAYLHTLSEQQINQLDMTSMLSNLLHNGVDIAVTPISGGWVEVDNPSDIALYEAAISQSNWHHDWRN